MKKIILFTWLSFAPFFMDAQQSLLNMIKDHEQTFGTNQIVLSGNFISFETENQEKSSIDKIIIDIADLGTINSEHQKSLLKQARTEGFEEYLEVRESQTKVNILIKEKDESIQAALLQINGDEETIHLYIQGNFKFSDLGNLDLNIEGMDQLKKAASKD
jgi:hypothetical protein